MANDSVGQIGLDLVVNKGSFEKQMKGIQGLAVKAGKTLAAAFAVKKIVDFGAQCVELGSDLQEVQNVVDVTFPRMQKKVNDFAQNAASSFGLSETMAKRFTGTFGAMAKAFGFGEKAAYDMSTTLTGLAGDVASFYNISQDEAYTKLKSVFTGETESLKDLGVVMTQTALDSYALANGYGKTTKAMSEAEKVALRYKFVQDQLSAAQGDFARTSDSWANQIRVLKLQFESLKATIGQGLINALTPVIKVINTIIGKLMSLANAFKSFTDMLSGNKGSGGAAATAAGMEAVAAAASNAESAVSGAGSAAKKAAKDIKGATTGIDELNIIQAPDESDSGSGGGAGGYAADEFDMGEIDTSGIDELDNRYASLLDRWNQLKNSFAEGFRIGFGDFPVLDAIEIAIERIKIRLRNLFSDDDLKQSLIQFQDTFVRNIGMIAGSTASIGTTAAYNLVEGIDRYLAQNSQRIKEYLVSMFDIGSEISAISGRFSVAVADIFAVFQSDSAKQITADLIGIFADSFMGITELGGKFIRDLLQLITKPITDNAGQIKERIQGLLDELQPKFNMLKSVVDGMWDGLNTAYDTFAKPVFDAFTDAISGAIDWITETQGRFDAVVGSVAAFFGAWQVIKLGEFIINAGGVTGALTTMRGALTAATTGLFSHAAALIADKIETAAIVALYAKDFVVNTAKGTAELVKQAAQFAVNTAAKAADAVAQAAMTAATVAWNVVCTAATALTTALGAAMAFLTSPIGLVVIAITGLIAAGVLLYKHWDEVRAKALEVWDGIKLTINTVWESIKTTISTVSAAIKATITAAWTHIKTTTNNIWNAIKTLLNTLWEWLKSLASSVFETIRDAISTAWESIKNKTTEVWNAIKEFVSGLWDTVKTAAAEKFTAIKDAITDVWDAVQEKTSDIWNGIWTVIRGVINSILGGVEAMANGVVRGINKMIDALNSISFDIPDWVPEFGGKSFGFDIPSIPDVRLPRLAQGGFVRANTPQLAMIGDNRHYGEIVAPEDKMQEMANRAVAMASQGGMSDQYLLIMIDLLKEIISLIEAMDLTVKIDIRDIRKKLVELERRSGVVMRTT